MEKVRVVGDKVIGYTVDELVMLDWNDKFRVLCRVNVNKQKICGFDIHLQHIAIWDYKNLSLWEYSQNNFKVDVFYFNIFIEKPCSVVFPQAEELACVKIYNNVVYIGDSSLKCVTGSR